MGAFSERRPVLGWGALVASAVLAAAGAVWYVGPSSPPPAPPAAPAADVSAQVRQFCGACHAYPPPDTFPRHAWKNEVERGYLFFAQSSAPLDPPPLDATVKYYEARAPLQLPEAVFARAATPLPVRLARTGIAGPPDSAAPAVANVNLVHLSDPRRLDVLACEMRAGLVMALKPYASPPAWQVLGKVPNPAHAEVVDLDGDGIQDILVADLGSFTPTDRRCGRVVWLHGRTDGTYAPVTLLEGVGRVADVRAADFTGDGKLDLVVAVFGWQQSGEILLLEN